MVVWPRAIMLPAFGPGTATAGALWSPPAVGSAAILRQTPPELLDVAQTAVSLMFVMEEDYGADIGSALDRHVQKLIDKGYLKIE